MSMITCCPACRTLFRVVPDQLRISDGWVRCGKCAEVFDGAACMVDEPPAPVAPVVVHGAPVPAVAAPEVKAPASEAPRSVPVPVLPVVVAALTDEAAQTLPGIAPEAAVVQASTEPEPKAEPEVEATADVEPVRPPPAPTDDAPPPAAEPPPVAPGVQSERPGLDGLATAAVQDAHSTGPVAPDPPVDAPEVAAGDVSFLRASRRKAFWRKKGVRGVLSLSALLLSLTLSVQVALQEHDRLATQWPVLRPALEQLCVWRDCEVGPWRQIDAIVIEGSSFNRLRGDVYRLGLGLRNTVALALAVPSIELSLTDNLDQTVLRRVLTPAELGLSDDVLAAGRDWSGSVTLQVSLPTGTPRIAGYRVLAFYP